MAAVTGQTFRSKMARVGKIAGAALAGAFVLEAKNAIATTEDLTKTTISLHKNLGIANKTASEFAGVLKARGADTTKVGMAFKTLATQISAANDGSTTSIAVFKELGFSHADIQKSLTDTEFAIGKVADGLNALPAGADKATISGKLFGRGWQTLAPVLRDGSAAMQEQLDTVAKYGGVLEGKTLKAQKDFLASQRESKIAWQGLQVQLATHLTPVIEKADQQFQHIAKVISDPKLTEDQKFSKVADILQKDFDTAIGAVLDRLPDIANKVGEEAPKVASAFVSGFLHADVWGKLAIGAFLISKFGGWGAIGALGRTIGTRIGGGIAGGVAAGEATGLTAAGAAGGGAGVAGLSAVALPLGIAVAGGIGANALSNKLGLSGPSDSAFEQMAKLAKESKHLGGESVNDILKFQESLRGLQDQGIKVSDSPANFQSLADRVATHSGSIIKSIKSMSDHQRQALSTWTSTELARGEISRKTADKIGEALAQTDAQEKRHWQNIADTTGESVQKIKDDVGNMTAKVSKDYQGMVRVTGGGIDFLGAKTNDFLHAIGADEAKFRVDAIKNIPHGANLAGLATGGLAAMVPGTAPGDHHTLSLNGVPVAKVESSEGIFVGNRDLMSVMRALNEQIPRRAQGGSVNLMPGVNMAMGSEPQILRDLGIFSHLQGKPVYVISGYRSPAHSVAVGGFANDPHTRGAAADIGLGSPTLASMMSLGLEGPLNRSGLHRPYYPPSSAEANHVELLAGAARAAMAFHLAHPLLIGPAGALRDAGQGALDKTWVGALKYGRHQMAKLSPTVNSISADGNVERVFAKIAKRLSTSKTATLALGEAGFAESGMRDLLGGDSTSQGALQLLASTAAGMGISPHDEGAIASAFLLRGFYGKGGANALAASGLPAYAVAQAVQGSAFSSGSNYAAQEANARGWMQRYGLRAGGEIPWFGDGADFIATHRQVIGVGDGGAERVQVTPVGGGRRQYALTITNWRDGTGYIRELAEDVTEGRDAHHERMAAMSRP